jgi:hypothetical protein
VERRGDLVLWRANLRFARVVVKSMNPTVELFLQWFENGKATGVPVETVQAVFNPHLQVVDLENWKIRYGDSNECGVGVVPLPSNRSLITLISMAAPCADARLWTSLFTILNLGNCVLFGSNRTVVMADLKTAKHLPWDLAKSGVEVRQISGGAEIRHAIGLG